MTRPLTNESHPQGEAGAKAWAWCESFSPLGNLWENEMEPFEQFWEAWPKSTRKGAKSKCRQKWISADYSVDLEQIIKHVEWLKTTDDWKKQNGAFIPAPLVYLNQARWDGAEVPELRKPVDTLKTIQEEREKTVPMPAHIREKLNALRGRK